MRLFREFLERNPVMQQQARGSGDGVRRCLERKARRLRSIEGIIGKADQFPGCRAAAAVNFPLRSRIVAQLPPVADRCPQPRGDSCEMICAVCPQQIPRKQLHHQQHPIALNQRQAGGRSRVPASRRDGGEPPPRARRSNASRRCGRAGQARRRRRRRKNPRRKPPTSSSIARRYMAAHPSGHRTSSTRSNWPLVELAGAAAAVLAVGIDQMAAFVDVRRARVLPDQDFGGGHADVVIQADHGFERLQPARIGLGVVVEQRDELGLGGGEALVVGGAEAPVGRGWRSAATEPG